MGFIYKITNKLTNKCISKSSINNGIKDPTKIRCGFIWKRIE